MPGVLGSLRSDLPRPIALLQLGGLISAFGNGFVLPFTFIYLHNVRDISLGLSGVILATSAVVGLVANPVSGRLVDRLGGKTVLGVALVVQASGYAGATLITEPWHGFLAMTVVGAGTGLFWPAQSTLIAGLSRPEQRPVVFGMQRVVMNLGVGLGALVGGVVADADRPVTFTAIFLVDAATFLVYLGVLLTAVPDLDLGGRRAGTSGVGSERGSYRDVFRHRAFLGVVGLNALFIFAGMSGFELLPVYAKNEAAVTETGIGIVFFVNTVVIVLAQLPITRAVAGRRRMSLLAALGALWCLCWVAVAIAGSMLDAVAATVAFSVLLGVFAIGECLHGAVQGPLVADLAEPRLMGRYQALSALSWQAGFALGPAVGGFLLAATPTGTWLVWAGLCAVAGALAIPLGRMLPAGVDRSPSRRPA